MSQPASVTQTGATFEISGLISFQWRAGTPSNPNWTSFITDQFELDEQGYSGIVRVYGAMPRIYSNMLRATYVAGYPVDWQNAGNGTTHQLPADLTNLAKTSSSGSSSADCSTEKRARTSRALRPHGGTTSTR